MVGECWPESNDVYNFRFSPLILFRLAGFLFFYSIKFRLAAIALLIYFSGVYIVLSVIIILGKQNTHVKKKGMKGWNRPRKL